MRKHNYTVSPSLLNCCGAFGLSGFHAVGAEVMLKQAQQNHEYWERYAKSYPNEKHYQTQLKASLKRVAEAESRLKAEKEGTSQPFSDCLTEAQLTRGNTGIAVGFMSKPQYELAKEDLVSDGWTVVPFGNPVHSNHPAFMIFKVLRRPRKGTVDVEDVVNFPVIYPKVG